MHMRFAQSYARVSGGQYSWSSRVNTYAEAALPSLGRPGKKFKGHLEFGLPVRCRTLRARLQQEGWRSTAWAARLFVRVFQMYFSVSEPSLPLRGPSQCWEQHVGLPRGFLEPAKPSASASTRAEPPRPSETERRIDGMSGNKKRKLEEEAAAAASDGEVHAIDDVEVHVVTFSAPEFHLDASESAMLLKSALAPTHSKSAFSAAARLSLHLTCRTY